MEGGCDGDVAPTRREVCISFNRLVGAQQDRRGQDIGIHREANGVLAGGYAPPWYHCGLTFRAAKFALYSAPSQRNPLGSQFPWAQPPGCELP